jgi:hypothetical protein
MKRVAPSDRAAWAFLRTGLGNGGADAAVGVVRRQSLELFGHAREDHHAVGETRMLAAQRASRQREYAPVVGGVEQGVE